MMRIVLSWIGIIAACVFIAWLWYTLWMWLLGGTAIAYVFYKAWPTVRDYYGLRPDDSPPSEEHK